MPFYPAIGRQDVHLMVVYTTWHQDVSILFALLKEGKIYAEHLLCRCNYNYFFGEISKGVQRYIIYQQKCDVLNLVAQVE